MRGKGRPVQRAFVTLLGNESRQAYTIPIFSVVLSLLTGAILLGLLGKTLGLPITA